MTTPNTTPSGPVSTRDSALDMARRGFPVFPLMPMSKLPIQARNCPKELRKLAGGINIATDDEETIASWFAIAPNINYGIRTDAFCVLDVDVKNGKDGLDDYMALGAFDSTLKVRTPSGGFHDYYKAPPGGAGQRPITPSLDIRGVGGYVVGPGSVTPEGDYEIACNRPVAALPAKIEEKISKPGKRVHQAQPADSTGQTEPVECPEDYEWPVDSPEALKHAANFLKSHPPAIERRGGNNHTYKTACIVKNMGVSEDEAFDLILDHWNGRCQPPWSPGELKQVISNAYQYSQRDLGSNSAAFDFADVAKTAKPQEAAEALSEPAHKGWRLKYPSEVCAAAIAERERTAVVRGLIYPQDIGVMYAPPGAGKSNMALNLAYHVALGKGDDENAPDGAKPSWCGRRIRRALVLYAGLEGEGGVNKRILALRQDLGDAGVRFATVEFDFFTLASSAGAGQADDGVRKIIGAANELSKKAGEPTGLIIIDTLSRAAAGDDENAQHTMAHLIQMVQRIAKATGAAVMLIHHTNKLGEMRGSTVLNAACDFVLKAETVGLDGKKRRLTAVKLKDGETGPLCDFELKQVLLGLDDEGADITSCVVRKSPPSKPSQPSAERQKKEPLHTRTARAVFAELEARLGETEDGVVKIPMAEFRSKYFKDYGTQETTHNAKKQAFKRAKIDLQGEFEIVDGGEFIVRHPLVSENGDEVAEEDE